MAIELIEGGYSVLDWFNEKICKNCSNYRTAKCWPRFTREKENSDHMSYHPDCYEIFMELKSENNIGGHYNPATGEFILPEENNEK